MYASDQIYNVIRFAANTFLETLTGQRLRFCQAISVASERSNFATILRL